MPADLLLPAFALTLAVNAIFVAVAIRALRTDRTRRAAPPTARVHAERPVASIPQSAPDGSEPPAGIRPEVDPVEPTPEPEPADSPPEALGVAAEPVVPPADPVPSARSAAPASRRRRKFSLPPLDDDHDKVSRSIRTFLAGTDSPVGAAADPSPASGPPSGGVAMTTPDAPPTPAAPPIVTVASIQLVGGGPRDVLERTVRSTARAGDEVSVDRRGRVRVVLGGTGEVAAHAYLRRIRATVEPLVEAADPPSRIVIATATQLDGDVATARRRADRRLTVALRAATPPTGAPETEDSVGHDEPEPRAAGH